MKTRAAIYARISRDTEAKKTRKVSAAIERQIEDCAWFCEEHGWKIVKTYTDTSISAYSGVNRPAYDRMLKDFERGKFDIIVVWKLDRLTRNTYGAVDMVRELEPLGLRIYSDDLGELDMRTIEGRHRAIGAAMQAEAESARKSQRQKRANLQRARRGKPMKGRRCFGYDRQNNIIEEEADVVHAIYKAYLRGSSMSAIARAVAGKNDSLPEIPHSDAPSVIFAREAGQPIPNKEFDLSTVQVILRNPKYAGYVYYNPVKRTDPKGKPRGESTNSKWRELIMRDEEHQPIRGNWEPIVDEETWWQVQTIRDANLTKADGTIIPHNGSQKRWFGAGLYRCGVCGKPMKSSDQGYRCDGHINRMRNRIDPFVLDVIRERISRPDFRDWCATLRQPTDPKRVSQIDEELRHARGLISAFEDDYANGDIPAALYKKSVERQEAKIAALEAERTELTPQPSAIALLDKDDPVKAFDSIKDPGQLSHVIGSLCTITLLPHGRHRYKSAKELADSIRFDWKITNN